ncbi:hypothetical protein X732_30330 [Mesorhizobium sp. L2C066B000]|nr:hypothetical protein X732_30330 [Mesorhizobium sp. L2C066B000]
MSMSAEIAMPLELSTGDISVPMIRQPNNFSPALQFA